MKVAVLLGAPGSGKGTQAKQLIDEGFRHYSTGDMLRAAIKEGTDLGRKARTFMDKGELVPDDVMIALIEGTFSGLAGDSRVLLDGFPRTVPQAEALDRKELTSVGLALNFVVPEEALVERLTGRRTCAACGATYHLTFMPPARPGVCDKCGATDLVQRSDDREDVVRNRLSVFAKQIEGLLSYYRDRGILRDIDANREPGVIHEELVGILEKWSR